MSSDPEDNVTYNKPQYKPPTPMRNYTPRGYSDRNFNPEYHRPNMSRSPPFVEQHDGRQSKNRRMMTESEIEEEDLYNGV